MAIKTFPWRDVGTGLRDYSNSAEFVSYSTLRGHQGRYQLRGLYTQATPPWPSYYAMYFMFYDVDGVLGYPAPSIFHHIYSVEVSCDSSALVLVGVYRFLSYADILIWNVAEWYGDMLDYGEARLDYSKGVRTVPGSWYMAIFGQYSARPTFTANVMVHMLREEVIGG